MMSHGKNLETAKHLTDTGCKETQFSCLSDGQVKTGIFNLRGKWLQSQVNIKEANKHSKIKLEDP